MGIKIGKVTEVRGVNIKAELYELLPPYIIEKGKSYVAPRINTYVKTKVGLDEIICQITGEYYDELHKGQFTGYFLELSVKGYFQGNKFIQGLRLLPMVAANVELLEQNEFKQINENCSKESFDIGKDLFDNTQDYSLSFNAIIPSHIGIFGNTGSGKSNTLAKILYEYSKILKSYDNGQILIFDLNNEYGANSVCNQTQKTIYNLTTKNDKGDKVPLNFEILQEDEWCLLLNATEATQRPVIKTAYHDTKTADEYREIVIRMLKTGQEKLIKSIQYHISAFIKGIDEFKWHTKCEKFYVTNTNQKKIFIDEREIKDYLNNITIEIPEERLERFLFRLYFATAIHIGYGTQFEYISPLLRRAEKLILDFKKVFLDTDRSIFEKNKIAVIQLANVNKDMTELIPAIITNHLFHKQMEIKGDGYVKNIVNIVIDEAHNLLYEDNVNYRHTKITIEAFEKAIKEGRKFGLYIWIASQRPSDISQTIISQLHNYFIHKLVNPYDLNRIRKAVAFLDENSMNSLTVLGPGECVVTGTGINMPCFVKVQQLEKEFRPNSENVTLFGKKGILKKHEESKLPFEW